MATSNLRKITADTIQGVQATKNYISNGNFENNTVTNWSLFNTTLTSGVPTGTITSGAASLTLNPTSSNVLFDGYSMQIVAGSTWTAGQGFISDAFTVDRGDLGKVLTFKFYYQAVSGGLNANWSGILGSQSLSIYIYDATVGAWIQPAGFLGMNQNSGAGYVTGTFQSSVTVGQQYRIAILGLQTTSGAITVNFDNFVLNSQTSPVGSAMTDWQSYTPILSGFTTSAMNALWRRVGDSVEIIAKFTKATHSASEMRFGLPPGLTSADTSKIPSIRIAGDNVISNANTPATTPYVYNVLIEPSVTYLTFGMQGTGNQGLVKQNANNYFGATAILTFQAKVPIAGWGSFSQMSSDTDTRVVSFSGTQSSQAVTGNVTNISFTATKDTHGAWSTNQYVVPVSGDYLVSASLITSGAGSLDVYRNGSRYGSYLGTSSSAAGYSVGGSALVTNCVAGDTLSIRHTQNVTLTSGYASFNRLSGPSVITATETVAASYWPTANNSITAANPFNFDGKEYDTHNAVTTGASWKFTAPVSGKYSVKAFLNPFSTPPSSPYFSIYKNGSLYSSIGWMTATTANCATGTIALNAGDYIDLRPNSNFQMSGNVSRSVLTNCSIQIERVGN